MGGTGWVATTNKAARWARRNWRTQGPWKSRAVEKSKSRLSHRAWKSRKVRGIPTFPPPRRLREINQTGHFTCYRKRTSSLAKNILIFSRSMSRCGMGELTFKVLSMMGWPAATAIRMAKCYGQTESYPETGYGKIE